VERERIGHGNHYDQVRHSKAFKHVDEYFGGRESMKARHQLGYHMKSFNENLNPLYGWLRSVVGKPWDKSYSELRQKFDARSTVNAHILQHLFQDVETNTYVGEKGAVMFMDTRYTNKGEQPIKKCYKDYFVCPKSGCLRKTQKAPRRSVVKEQEANALKARLAVARLLEDGSELHLIDGLWWHLTFAILPKATITYVKPVGVTEFKVGYSFMGKGQQVKTWNELNQTERERFGAKVYSVEGVTDLKTGARVVPSTYKEQRYACTKQQASRKLLRAHGLDGTAAANDGQIMSHREAAKYRVKKAA
jgi:hypothetical protein